MATEVNGNVRQYIPKDAETREEMVKLAMQKPRSSMFRVDSSFYLLLYSNSPNQIQDFGENYEPIKVSIIKLGNPNYI